MATRLKGQSKREAAAAKVGGKLDYKTGKISTPVTTKISAPKTSTTSNPFQFSSPGQMQSIPGQNSNTAFDYSTAKSVPTPAFDYSTAKSTPSSSKKSSGSSTRSTAASVTPSNTGLTSQDISNDLYSGGLSMKGGVGAPKMTTTGRVLQILNDPMGTGAKLSQSIKDTLGYSGDITRTLGLDSLLRTAEASAGPQELASKNIFQIAAEGAGLPPLPPNDSPIPEPSQNNKFDYSTARSFPVAPSRAPQQTTNAPTVPLTTLISQVVNHPDFQSAQPDTTPVDNGQAGTQRQFLGNGLLSSGKYGNGAGDYGIQGNMGTGQVSSVDDLMTILGLKTPTAQAMENPSMMSSMQTTPVSAFQQSFANGGLSGSNPFGVQSISPTNRAETPAPTPKANTRNASIVQQTSQGATGGNSTANPMLDYQNKSMKGFSAQEKAQKKALEELIKSIKNQYSTSQTTGINDLNTAKQQDLLKLSGLFSFANQDPNSEQRIQYEQRANQDYAKQQADFLAKLAGEQQSAISQANQGYQGKLADIAKEKNATSLEIAKLLENARQKGIGKGGETQKNTNPNPTVDSYGNYWDRNPHSPTYGKLVKTDENGNMYIDY